MEEFFHLLRKYYLNPKDARLTDKLLSLRKRLNLAPFPMENLEPTLDVRRFCECNGKNGELLFLTRKVPLNYVEVKYIQECTADIRCAYFLYKFYFGFRGDHHLLIYENLYDPYWTVSLNSFEFGSSLKMKELFSEQMSTEQLYTDAVYQSLLKYFGLK